MPKSQERPSLLKRGLVGDVETSPLRKVLGDRPLSDPNSPLRKAAKALGKAAGNG